MQTLVHGLFRTEASAEKAVQALLDAHIAPEDVHVLVKDGGRTTELPLQPQYRIARFAKTGAICGALIGAIIVPVLELLETGPIVGIVLGAAAGAALAGFCGAFAGLGFWRDEPPMPRRAVHDGGIVVGAELTKGHDIEETVREVLRDSGAEGVRALPKQEV